jgi:5-methyltetrahydrofolate--homocysteine methyltransferase
LKGKFPAILDDAVVGTEARRLHDDARRLLDRIVAEGGLRARGVYGFFAANTLGDDILLYTDDVTDSGVRPRPHPPATVGTEGAGHLPCPRRFHRSGGERPPRLPRCLRRHRGPRLRCPLLATFDKAHDDYSSILVKAIADRLAEAAAEWLHARVRRRMGLRPG